MKIKWSHVVLVVIGVLIFVAIFYPATNPVQPNTSKTVTKTVSTSVPAYQAGGSSSSVGLQPDGQYIVRYTNSGFSPKTMQIPRGKIIKFVNDTDKALSIVSDSQGSIFSQINQPKPIGRGGVYTFDFVYVGVWAFHNAGYPSDHGNIVVY